MEEGILSTRNGRTSLVLAKLLAGGMSVVLSTLIDLLPMTIACSVLYGLPLQAQIQLYLTYNPCMSLLAWQELLILTGELILYGLLFGGLIVLVSTLTGSSLAGLATTMLLYVYEYAFNVDFEPSKLLKSDMFGYDHLTKLFGFQFNKAQTVAVTFLALAAVSLAVCRVAGRYWATRRK